MRGHEDWQGAGPASRSPITDAANAPLVKNPEASWPYPAVITHSPWWHGTNHAVRSTRYYYVRYRDGTEELYDMSSDPHQWQNLAHKPGYAATKEDLKKMAPEN